MNGWRVAAVVEFGMLVGVTFALVRNSSTADALRTEQDQRIEAVQTQMREMTAELTTARDARRRPRETSQLPAGAIPNDTRVPFDDPNAVPAKPAAPAADAPSAEARTKRRDDLVREMHTWFETHDGEKALAGLKELAAIVPEGRDAAMKLAVDINKDVQGAGDLHLSQFVYYSGLGDPAVKDLMLWSMDNQGASLAEFRVLAAWSIPWAMKPDEAIAKYDAALAHEPDRNVQYAIINNLASMNTSKAEAVLVKLFGDTTRDSALRGDAAMALATSKDPAVQRAIETAAQGDPDARVQTAAKVSLVIRDPPATGVLVTQTVAEGNAEQAGIRPGDVIVSYNGKAVPTGDDLRREIGTVSGAETVPLLIVRDGREQTIAVKPGRLGLPNLHPVTKK